MSKTTNKFAPEVRQRVVRRVLDQERDHPLIPSTMPPDQVASFGKETPIGRPAQPKELAPVYVMPATDEASYVSGATVAVTGSKPLI